ncbi:hypothetical protein PENSPDRAFT_652754 [Peniophora sp. CONT]|nr:hypothetical protein PENSPDRAFT_652754 [Peniophora sp. CONT]
MPRVIFDGLVEYEDGTPATTAQLAKDVVTFLLRSTTSARRPVPRPPRSPPSPSTV